MSNFINNLLSEFLKLCCCRVTRIVSLLIIGLQAFLSFISAKQILEIGLDATPADHPELAQALPPLEYMGFEEIFGTIPMIVLGGIYGAMEYKRHCMRTTMLSSANKNIIFFTKVTIITLVSFILSFLSVFTSVSVTHLAFGDQGLDPVVLSSRVWQLILLASTGITLLTVLAFSIGFLFRSAVIPLIFLIIQAYNVGDMLAEHFSVCRILPVWMVNNLIGWSDSAPVYPLKNILGITAWIIVIGCAGFIRFKCSDIRGEY